MARLRRKAEPRPAAAAARLRALAACCAAAAMCAGAQPASAQEDAQQKAAAEALFEEGRQLLEQGQYETACKRFEQSQQIDSGVGTLLYLADCYEKSGKTASAWAIFREASSAAMARGQEERSRLADERARRLMPSLSKLVLLVPQENRSAGVEILLDGKPVSAALFGVPFPVDPGTRELTARAPGRAPWSYVVEIKPNADYRSVQVPVLAPGSPMQPLPRDYGTATSAAAPPPLPGEPLPAAMSVDDSANRTPGYIVGGAGLLAIGVGVIFGVRAADKEDEARPGCPSGCVSQAAEDLNESARTSALIANISYGVGLAALATGIYLYFSAEPSSPSAQAHPGLKVGGSFGSGEGLLSVTGEF